MKPQLIFINQNGKAELSADEIKKMVEDAYQRGYEDGKKENQTIVYPTLPYTNPALPWTITCCDAARDAMCAANPKNNS